MLAQSPLLALNYGLRGAAFALLLLIGLHIWREARSTLAGQLGVAFALSAAAYALYFSPGLALPSALWHVPLALLAQGAAVLFWLLLSALFNDDFQLRYWHGLIWLAVGLLGFAQFFVLIPALSPYRSGVGAVLDIQPVMFALIGLWQAVARWQTDLIELRRHLRGVILLVTVANIGVVALTKLLIGQGGYGGQGELISLVEAAAVAAAALAVQWQLQHQGLGEWVMQRQAACAAPAVEPVALTKTQPVDPAMLAALEDKLAQERIYRDETLSIGSLAQRMGVQEYQLRRLINQGLGYRNFNAFVNHYRLVEAQASLADPARRHVAVLNIAMDCGFGSLGPFNRAFKAQTGQTPTEFRKASLPD